MSKNEYSGLAGRAVKYAVYNAGDIYRLGFYVGLASFIIITLFPFYWLFVLAITPSDQLYQMGVVPENFDPSVFITVFQQYPLHHYIFNSIIIASITVVVCITLGSLAGYAFGRIDFPGKGPLLLLLLVISYFPGIAFLIPLFELLTGSLSALGFSTPDLYNTPWGMVFPFTMLSLPITIFILTTFYSQIPDGLEDAARVEGTTRLGALFRVIMPLSAPGVVTAAIIVFIGVYREFFFSFIMTDGSPENWAVLVYGILNFQQQYTTQYNLMAAASLMGVIPIAVLVILAQEHIVSGLTAGGLKE
ncbi:carbohydrate ABC transporter permease [Halopelagius longus]|uniref:Carbohydrate ABC transporter membrane protein 2, CUT1 family n=1 Tax=Halopelagius longus TaxID=1236180 RepID=A0A1H1G2K0_9EURY|nr:carbohydrate ABC transporter permease [Halopelagius longus]RDI69881.1 carbohydrate ABC transporter permease [Halopelagius longus]SDR07462.1 carbohydrate ABC transporter membrane protein 2, CUT1 family [Halopelagius longus]